MIWRKWWKREPRDLAKEFLIRQGFHLLAEQWETPNGRVDFVVTDRETLVLVKVRSRGVSDAHDIDEELSTEALAKLCDACRQSFPAYQQTPARFDVLRLDWYGRTSKKPVLRYFPNAAIPAKVDVVSRTT